jgi:SAM-dependent methyltransferase
MHRAAGRFMVRRCGMDGPRVDTVRLQAMARAYCQSALLFSAIDLDLFTMVAKGEDTEVKLARALDLSALNTERLVTACLAIGLLAWEGDRLVNAPDVQRFLVRGEPAYAGPWMTFTRPDVGKWFEMTTYLRAKKQPKLLGAMSELTVEDARRYHEATNSIGMGAGRRFARHVDLTGRRLLLDLGGGSGAYSICAVQAFPGLCAVVFDLPPVVEAAKEFLGQHGVEDRVSAVGGDFTSDPLPDGADVVVMASNLVMYDQDLIQAVVSKAYGALVPGGEMHLVGEMLDDDRTGPLDAALWGLGELMYESAGKTHTVGQCLGYFQKAGFVEVADHDFVPGVLRRVSGIKRP